jgi:L-serine dehydratase
MSKSSSSILPIDFLARSKRHDGTAVDLPPSVLDLFKIGIGPSSSHTIGPMKAAAQFSRRLSETTARVSIVVFGSLAWTGKGHATDKAIVLGLLGQAPETLDPDDAIRRFDDIKSDRRLELPNGRLLDFVIERDIIFDKQRLFERHPNAMQFGAFDAAGQRLAEEIWFSIGGGFVERMGTSAEDELSKSTVGFEFRSADELLALCRRQACTIAEVAMVNELARRTEIDAVAAIDRIIDAMMSCIDRGITKGGELPGGLRVKRRAADLFRRLEDARKSNARLSSEPFDHISAFAIAVNEENAAGGRVVTAPTNGAAGVIPAVLRYYREFCPAADQHGMRTLLLTAGAIAES